MAAEGRPVSRGALDRARRRRIDRVDLDHDQRRHRSLVLHRRVPAPRNRGRCDRRSAPPPPFEPAGTNARVRTDPTARRHLLRRLPVALADDRPARRTSDRARRNRPVAGPTRNDARAVGGVVSPRREARTAQAGSTVASGDRLPCRRCGDRRRAVGDHDPADVDVVGVHTASSPARPAAADCRVDDQPGDRRVGHHHRHHRPHRLRQLQCARHHGRRRRGTFVAARRGSRDASGAAHADGGRSAPGPPGRRLLHVRRAAGHRRGARGDRRRRGRRRCTAGVRTRQRGVAAHAPGTRRRAPARPRRHHVGSLRRRLARVPTRTRSTSSDSTRRWRSCRRKGQRSGSSASLRR